MYCSMTRASQQNVCLTVSKVIGKVELLEDSCGFLSGMRATGGMEQVHAAPHLSTSIAIPAYYDWGYFS